MAVTSKSGKIIYIPRHVPVIINPRPALLLGSKYERAIIEAIKVHTILSVELNAV